MIDKTSFGNKIEVGVMVDPAQGFKSQVVHSDPIIPLCATHIVLSSTVCFLQQWSEAIIQQNNVKFNHT